MFGRPPAEADIQRHFRFSPPAVHQMIAQVKTVIHDGKKITIAHLAPMRITCPCEPIGRELLIDVGFSNHCYTEKFVKGVHAIEQIIITEAEDRHRIFCPTRYELSHRLPDLIKSLPKSKVHQTAQLRNYVYVVPMEIDDKPYEIYFMLQRAVRSEKADLRLTIESAYIAEAGSSIRKRPGSIRFVVLAHKVLSNQPIKFAPR